MTRIYVSLDLETTGLDPQRDNILEIGAVKFRGDEVLDTFTSLINPGRPIPQKITELTGIADAMVQTAPSLFSVLPRLDGFVRDLPVIGHNVAFDLGFVRRHRILQSNESLDTFELAGILVPHEERYSLGKLTQSLGVPEPQEHRALSDAQLAYQLFLKLFDRACQIPAPVLEEIVKHSQKAGWTPGRFFEDALKASARGAFEAGSIGAQIAAKQAAAKRKVRQAAGAQASAAPMFMPPVDAKPLQPKPELESLDVDLLARLLQQGGALSQQFPNYEFRPQQVRMMRAVAESLNNGGHLLVEAGTGTGKSLAYLLPAVHWAHTNGLRVVISTNTINLQEQLYHKDLPDLARILPFEFHAAVLKGRSHYLCPTRLNSIRRSGPASPEEMRVLCKVLLWLPGTVTGDGDELFLPNPVERAIWARLSADHETCTPERCAAFGHGQCFFYRARQAAEAAHVVIVNHALLLADIAVDNRALPEYQYLIIDEAHHLEDATTQQLGFTVDRAGMQRMLAEIGKVGDERRASGLLADYIGRVRHATPAQIANTVQVYVEQAAKAVETVMRQSDDLFDRLMSFVDDQRGSDSSEYSFRLRIVQGLRTQPSWSGIEIAADNLGKGMFAIAESLGQLAEGLTDLAEYDVSEAEDVQARLLSLRREVAETRQHLEAILVKPVATGVYWAELSAQNNSGRNGTHSLALHAAPLHVGPLVERHLFKAKSSVIMTSATLRTGGDFNFVKERLHAWDADELAVGSPFDYKSSTLFYIVSDMPEPGEQGYQRALEQGLISLCRAMGGRTMVLFTSYSQLRATSKVIVPALAKDDVTVYEQSDGSSRRQLLENFKTAQRGVLLGTRSFWEGVDVPGEALSCLVIVRLPFAVPSDPVFAARSETFEQAFTEYSVPDAILRFRQGFGRLIRTANDRGVVAVFDKRLLTKTYGQTFIKSLPDCTIRRGPQAEIARAVTEWMNRERKA